MPWLAFLAAVQVVGFANGCDRGVRDRHCPFTASTCQVQCLTSSLEGHSAVTSSLSEALLLHISSSEDMDVVSIKAEESETHHFILLPFKELVEVITYAVPKLNIE